jgi:hypothetical protein
MPPVKRGQRGRVERCEKAQPRPRLTRSDYLKTFQLTVNRLSTSFQQLGATVNLNTVARVLCQSRCGATIAHAKKRPVTGKKGAKMTTETETINSAAEVFKAAARIFAEVPAASSMRLMELSTQGEARRWRELVSWQRESTEADVVALLEPYLGAPYPLALWARQGRRKLREHRFSFGEEESEIEFKVSPPAMPSIEAAPLALGKGEIQTAHEMLRDQVMILREELAAERTLVRDLISEALTTGRGSQASLVKLITLQGGLLADAWKVQATAQAKETRRLEALRAETSEAEETAVVALEEAAEAKQQAEQGGQLIAALIQELGPELIGSVLKGGE